jgi:hypothetical protein
MNGRIYRITLRWLHVFWGSVLGIYVYMPSAPENDLFVAFIRYFVFPALAIEGVLLWQQARVLKLFQRHNKFKRDSEQA